MSAGVGWPVHWYELGRARGKIFRSRDAGKTWERLLGGLPNGQRALFSGLTIEARNDGYSLYAADTDGQVFESLDDGDTWTIIADVPPVSKARLLQGAGSRPRQARQRRRHRRQSDRDQTLAGGGQGIVSVGAVPASYRSRRSFRGAPKARARNPERHCNTWLWIPGPRHSASKTRVTALMARPGMTPGGPLQQA